MLSIHASCMNFLSMECCNADVNWDSAYKYVINEIIAMQMLVCDLHAAITLSLQEKLFSWCKMLIFYYLHVFLFICYTTTMLMVSKLLRIEYLQYLHAVLVMIGTIR